MSCIFRCLFLVDHKNIYERLQVVYINLGDIYAAGDIGSKRLLFAVYSAHRKNSIFIRQLKEKRDEQLSRKNFS